MAVQILYCQGILKGKRIHFRFLHYHNIERKQRRFLRDAFQPEVYFLHSWAVVLPKFTTTLNTTNLVLSRHIIRHLHISHNPFSVSLGTAVIRRRNEKQKVMQIFFSRDGGGGGGGK